MAPRGSDLKRKWLLATTAAALTLIIAGLAVEIHERRRYGRWRAGFDAQGWLGALTVPADEPELLWRYRPDAVHTHIRTNRWGFREDDQATRSKPAGVERIAFVGDSVTLGMGVRQDLAFVERVEAQAASEGAAGGEPPLETLNFGIDGYHARQIAALVRLEVLAFDPDTVVYVLSLNDFDFEDSAGEKLKYFQPPKSFLLRRLRRLQRKATGKGYYRYHFDRRRAEVEAAVRGTAQLLAARDVGYRVAVLPIFDLAAPGWTPYPQEEVHGEVVRLLATALAGDDDRVIDLLPAFVASDRPPAELALDIWHPNAAGHEIIARTLLAELSRGWPG